MPKEAIELLKLLDKYSEEVFNDLEIHPKGSYGNRIMKKIKAHINQENHNIRQEFMLILMKKSTLSASCREYLELLVSVKLAQIKEKQLVNNIVETS